MLKYIENLVNKSYIVNKEKHIADAICLAGCTMLKINSTPRNHRHDEELQKLVPNGELPIFLRTQAA